MCAAAMSTREGGGPETRGRNAWTVDVMGVASELRRVPPAATGGARKERPKTNAAKARNEPLIAAMPGDRIGASWGSK